MDVSGTDSKKRTDSSLATEGPQTGVPDIPPAGPATQYTPHSVTGVNPALFPKIGWLGNSLLLAQAPAAKRDVNPPQDIDAWIVNHVPGSIRRRCAMSLAAGERSGIVLRELAMITGTDESNKFFSAGLNTLIDTGIIGSTDELAGRIGERLIALAKKAGTGMCDFLNFAVGTLSDRKIVTGERLRSAFLNEDTWIDSLALAAGKMDAKEGWKALYFGIGSLIDLSLIRPDNIEEIFEYREGSMLCEMARATHILHAGRDYFGFMLLDWFEHWKHRTGTSKIDSQTIGAFIRQTAGPAQEFYNAGLNQRRRRKITDEGPRWRNVIRNFRGIMPMNDIPRLLSLLAKALDDPLDDTSLARYIEEAFMTRMLAPQNAENVRHAAFYGNFLESMTQQMGLRDEWISRNMSLSELSRIYKNLPPENIYDLAMTLNDTVRELGDNFIKKCDCPVPSWDGPDRPVRVFIDPVNLHSFYKRYYIIRVKNPKDLDRYHFIMGRTETGPVAVADFERWLEQFDQAKKMFGEAEAKKMFTAGLNRIDLKIGEIPEKVMTLKGLNASRMKLNELSGSGGETRLGERYIMKLSGLFSEAIPIADSEAKHASGRDIPIGILIRLLFGWSEFDSISDTPFYGDIRGNYQTIAGHIANRVCGYFDKNPGELGRYHVVAIRMKLKELGHPLKIDKTAKDEGDRLFTALEKL